MARRIEALRAAGALFFDADIDEKTLDSTRRSRCGRPCRRHNWPRRWAAIAAHPEVACCAATTGATNILVAVVCRDRPDFFRYLTERIGALPLVREVATAPLIRTVTRAGALP